MTTMIRKNRDKTQRDLVRDSQKFLFVPHLWKKKKKGQIGKKISFILRLDSVYTIVPNLLTNMMPLPRAILHNALTQCSFTFEYRDKVL